MLSMNPKDSFRSAWSLARKQFPTQAVETAPCKPADALASSCPFAIAVACLSMYRTAIYCSRLTEEERKWLGGTWNGRRHPHTSALRLIREAEALPPWSLVTVVLAQHAIEAREEVGSLDEIGSELLRWRSSGNGERVEAADLGLRVSSTMLSLAMRDRISGGCAETSAVRLWRDSA